MGFKCSLLGHNYGEAETAHERERRGEEVVVTVREIERCTRCDAESVVSETTEVRRAEPDDDAGVTDAADAADTTPEPTADSVGVDEALDAAPATEDDGVILDDEPSGESEDRRPGEWPPAEDTRMEDAEADDPPVEVTASEGAADDEDADAEADDETAGGEIVDGDPGGDEVAVAERATPESTSETVSDAGVSDGRTQELGDATGLVSDTAAPEPGDDLGRELQCPACEFSEPVLGSSNRAGDICPDCKGGYLTER